MWKKKAREERETGRVMCRDIDDADATRKEKSERRERTIL